MAKTGSKQGQRNHLREGRPIIEIDWELAERLASIQCTGEEIAAMCGCSYDTLDKRLKETYGVNFTQWFKEKGANGKVSLRRRQYEAAKGGNATMLIWLGKQWLGQTDKMDQKIEHEGEVTQKVKVSQMDLEERIGQLKGV